MVGLGGSLQIIEPWHGWVGRVLKDQSCDMVGLGGSLKIIEPWNGWVGRVLKDHRAMA